ncbi:MAG: polysaccharide biosynthesis tyrosine autokinase [Verrucomicrobia bacterium]|nr:polysaccharide biosynthesis tyrosine autokinase [Verrucomicrobiota bacterium]
MENFKAPEEAQDKLHFLDYWRVIRIRKAIIFTVFCIVLLSSAIFTNFMPEKYRSFARMDVQKDKTDVNLMDQPSFGQGFDPYWMQTQFEIIESTSVLYPVIEELKLRERFGEKYGDGAPMKLDLTYRLLSGLISLSQTRNTSIIRVSAVTYDSALSSEIANAVVDKYTEYRSQLLNSASTRGLDALREKELQSQKEIEDLNSTIEQMKKDNNIVDLSGDSYLDVYDESPEVIRQLAQDKIREEKNYERTKSLYEQFLSIKEDPKALRDLIESVDPDQRLTTMLLGLDEAQLQLVINKTRFTENHPDVRTTEAAIAQLNSQIGLKINSILEGWRVKLEEAKSALEITNNALDSYKDVKQSKDTNYRDYELAKRELNRKQRVLDAIRLKINSEEINKAIPRNSEVQIIDRAEPDNKAVSPSWSLNLVLGGIIGLSIGIGLAFFIEYLDTSVKTIDDVERALQAPVLGVIPQNVGSIIDEGPDSPHAEAYRVLRTNLLFSRKDKTKNTFSVVSGGAGEGKSTTLFNLATIFAQNNERVLVVDSDLRRPSIHKILGISNSLGLTNYLLGQNVLEEVIQTTQIPTLDILPSGKLPSSSMGILNSPQMKELVEILSKRYDYVFFDSPPIMGISDASVLASLVGYTVQVIQYRKYPQAMTIRAKQLVQKISNNLAGVVLNNINMSQDSDYYYYSGYYYDYYYSRNEDSDPTAKSKNGKPTSSVKPNSRSEKPGSVSDIKQKY